MASRQITIERGDSLERTIFPKTRGRVTRAELQARLAPVVREWLRAACVWEEADIGDYRFVTFYIPVTERIQLYVQFWSAPGEPVLWEVSSGRWNPPADKWLAGERAKRIEALGFEIGGEAENYQREIPRLDSPAALTRVARAVVDIFYSAFDYRGAVPVVARLVSEGRAESRSAYEAFSPDDVSKIFEACGFKVFQVCPDGEPDIPMLRCRKRGIDTFATFDDEIDQEELYQTVHFSADLELSPDEAEEAARTLPPPPEPGAKPIATLSTVNRISGGVTAEWLAARILEWEAVTAEHKREAQRGKRRRARDSSPPPVRRQSHLVH